MEGAQARVKKAMNTMVSSLDKDCLRKLQAEMYRCSTRCCEDQNSSLEEVQDCIERCSTRVNQAQNYIQNEMQMFQDRLQRCVLSCDDSVRYRFKASTTQEEKAKLQAEVEACAVKCADKHVEIIPGLTKNILDNISKNKV